MNDFKLFRTPILYLIFNRPDLVKQSFARIAAVRPSKLFVSADGPRSDREDDLEQCVEARRIVERIDWPCEVKTLFRDENLGCRRAVSEAITWFFEHVEEGIILEDDCVADASFFPFCEELLARYRDDERIMAISGDNFQPAGFDCGASYYFSKYPHCWGWATWRRAWKHYDSGMCDWLSVRDSKVFRKWFRSSREREYWFARFDDVYHERINSWAYVWTYSCWKNQCMTVIPCCNLVENIGFDDRATHTRQTEDDYEGKTESISFPLEPPLKVNLFRKADAVVDCLHFSGDAHSLLLKIKRLKWKIVANMKALIMKL